MAYAYYLLCDFWPENQTLKSLVFRCFQISGVNFLNAIFAQVGQKIATFWRPLKFFVQVFFINFVLFFGGLVKGGNCNN